MAVIGVILVFGILSFDLYGVIRNNIQKSGRIKAGQDKIQQESNSSRKRGNAPCFRLFLNGSF